MKIEARAPTSGHIQQHQMVASTLVLYLKFGTPRADHR